MAILTLTDRALYFPDCPVSGAALVAAIARAQMTAESAKGCNRPLELQPYTETKKLNVATQTCKLSRVPIAISPLPVIEARQGKIKDGFGRHLPVGDWITLDAAGYELDLQTGLLSLNVSSDRGFSTGLGQLLTEIKATYTTGFDFTIDTPQVQDIKAAVAAILLYQTGCS
jgi:hypothetical protein